MNIYVDKLPENCNECRFFYKHNYVPWCKVDGLAITIPSMSYLRYRSPRCQLKELTNAQLAIGWYQEGKKIVREDFNNQYLSKTDKLEQIVITKWKIKEKLEYTLTDWRGAREACNQGKRVTHVHGDKELLLIHTRNTSVAGYVYVLIDENKPDDYLSIRSWAMDGNDWKIWE